MYLDFAMFAGRLTPGFGRMVGEGRSSYGPGGRVRHYRGRRELREHNNYPRTGRFDRENSLKESWSIKGNMEAVNVN